MNSSSAVRIGTLVAAGSGLALVLIWSMCGRGGPDSPRVADQAPAVAPPVAAAPAEPSERGPEEAIAEAAPVIPPVVVPVVTPEANPSPPSVAAAPPVVVAPPVVAAPSVAAAPPVVAAPPVAAAPPPVVAPLVSESVPDQDLLIAKSASTRFKPDVAALAAVSLALRAPVQGDASLNVLQPCDTAASGCAQGLAPGQVAGGANDWSGFVLPGFPE